MPAIDVSFLPDISKDEMDFHDTSFFQSNTLSPPQLPTPSAILQQYPNRGYGVIKFDHLNLVVKYGTSTYLRLEEAQTMRAIRQIFPNNEIPVPEVFGWRKYGDQNIIYMSLIRGPTLQEAWPSLNEEDKTGIRDQLRDIVSALRRITQGPSRFGIGSINGGTLQDRYFQFDYEGGPFDTIKEYNDWLLAAGTRQIPGTEGFRTDLDGHYRDLLSDTGDIYFTHGDLTLTNIIVSGTSGSQKIVGVLDWEQSGWYPEYWEYCKLLFAVDYEHEWRAAGWAETVMRPFHDEWFAFGEYSLWRNL